VNRLWVPIAVRLIPFSNGSNLHGNIRDFGGLSWIPIDRTRRAEGLNPPTATEGVANSGKGE
jgi:hypothetical protein